MKLCRVPLYPAFITRKVRQLGLRCHITAPQDYRTLGTLPHFTRTERQTFRFGSMRCCSAGMRALEYNRPTSKLQETSQNRT
jgi:hypothetical protein